MTKITSEIFQVGGSGLSAPGDAAIYLMVFNGEAAIVDAGCGTANNKVFANIQSCGVMSSQIKYLLITHCHFDHTGGAKEFKDAMDCTIVAHELDAVFLERGDNIVTAAKWYGSDMAPFKVDRKISMPRDQIYLGDRSIEVIHTPGHSPGSVVYLVESEGLAVLFGQDVHGPLDPSLLSDIDEYQKSLRLLLSLKADILCEGHYGVFRGDREVEAFIRSFTK